MKNRRILILVCVISIAFIGFVCWDAGIGTRPVLVLKGYEPRQKTIQLAKLELRNTTRQPMWFLYARGTPFKPAFFDPTVATRIGMTNRQGMIFFDIRKKGLVAGKVTKLLPGQSLSMDWPVLAGRPAEQAGIDYYMGNFRDNADFLNYCWLPPLPKNATWKMKLKYYWNKYRFGSRQELWCEQELSFQPQVLTNAAAIK